MKLVSVNCGLPREVVWRGKIVTTSIYKQPIKGRVALRKFNLDGDGQADLSVHGGKDKAVYCYPLEHYEYWRKELPEHDFSMGAFGENFTIEGLDEHKIHIGDRFSMGSAEVVVTQPRLPCYKLGIRFESDQMVRQFFNSGRSGFYLAVTREGEVAPGDDVIRLSHESESVSVPVITKLYAAKRYCQDDVQTVRRTFTIDALPESWKKYFEDKLRHLGSWYDRT
jgi:MOSC domain-containing protein YiiM